MIEKVPSPDIKKLISWVKLQKTTKAFIARAVSFVAMCATIVRRVSFAVVYMGAIYSIMLIYKLNIQWITGNSMTCVIRMSRKLPFTPCKFDEEDTAQDEDTVKMCKGQDKLRIRKLKCTYVSKVGAPNMVSLRQIQTFDPNDFVQQAGGTLEIPVGRYYCSTQGPDAPIKAADVAHASGENISRLEVGVDGKIVLWHKDDTVNYTAYADGYPTPNHAIYAAQRLMDAADDWNSRSVGPKFKWVDKWEDAEFALAYGGDGGSTYAMAFFPNGNDLNTLFVYKLAFQNDKVGYMSNIFAHELGHALGLRHEFAPEREGGVVQVGPRNPNSVMSYNFPPIIQPSDVASARALYDLPDGAGVGGFLVTHIRPDN